MELNHIPSIKIHIVKTSVVSDLIYKLNASLTAIPTVFFSNGIREDLRSSRAVNEQEQLRKPEEEKEEWGMDTNRFFKLYQIEIT